MRWGLSDTLTNPEQFISLDVPPIPLFPSITVLQIIGHEASVLIDLPTPQPDVTLLQADMADGVLTIRYGNQSRSIPIFDDGQGEILRTEHQHNQVLIEVYK